MADSEKQNPSCAPHQSIQIMMSSEVIRKDIPSVSSTNFNSTSKTKSTKSVAVGSVKIKTVQQKQKGKSKDQIYKRTNIGNVYLCGNCQINLQITLQNMKKRALLVTASLCGITKSVLE